MKKQLLAATLISALSLLSAAAQAETTMQHDHGESTQTILPPHQVEMYLDGFHIYKKHEGTPEAKNTQVRVAHYCKHVSPELIQCLVYNGNGKDAKVIGIEYVIPETVYNKLPDNEKKYWHSHHEEVSTGMLTLPGMHPEKEKEVLSFIDHTYGKTWNLWQPGDAIPVGEPELMWPVNAHEISDATKATMAARKIDPKF